MYSQHKQQFEKQSNLEQKNHKEVMTHITNGYVQLDQRNSLCLQELHERYKPNI